LGVAPISMDQTTGTRLVPGTSLMRRWPALLIIVVGLFFYLDSFQGAFVYDEINFITNNPTIRQLWPPWPALLAPINVNRPLIGLTNAMNYGISGLNPWSYHALNLIIHLMAALALFGIGQGLFISPNNSAIVAAAPASLTGEAGGLINVMRSCGISVGVAAASALLAWRLAVLTGSGHNTLHAEAHELLEASRDVIVLLAGFAAIAGAMSLTRPPLRSRGPSDARGCA